MVPWPSYCAPLALSPWRVGNAPADTTNIETTTATPAARDTADRADFSRIISLPPETPVPQLAATISSGAPPPQLDMARNKRTSPPTAKPRRLSTAPGNYAYLSSPAPPSKSARALSGACQHFSMLRACGLACQLVSFVRSVPRRVVRAHPSEFLLHLGRGIPLG